MSSAKPMSSISSASSSTTVRTSSRSQRAAADVVERPARAWRRRRRRRARAPAAGGRSAGRRRSAATRTPSVAAVAVDRLGHLHRPARGSARGRAPTGRGLRAAGVEPLQQRQRERRRLAGAGGRLAEQVAPVEQRRDRLALDRRRLLVAEGGERVEQLGAQPEVGERAGVPERTDGGGGHRGAPRIGRAGAPVCRVPVRTPVRAPVRPHRRDTPHPGDPGAQAAGRRTR